MSKATFAKIATMSVSEMEFISELPDLAFFILTLVTMKHSVLIALRAKTGPVKNIMRYEAGLVKHVSSFEVYSITKSENKARQAGIHTNGLLW